MATVAKENKPAAKAERKKPVRKAPVQKDYPTKLDWLRAMTEYEVAQSGVTNAAKVARLEKRIAARKAEIAKLTGELTKLVEQRDALVPAGEEDEATEAESETPSA